MTLYKFSDAQPGPGGAPTEPEVYLNGRNNKRTGILFAARSTTNFAIGVAGAILVQGRVDPSHAWVDIAHINTVDWSAADGLLVAATTFTPMPQMRGGFKGCTSVDPGVDTITIWAWIPD